MTPSRAVTGLVSMTLVEAALVDDMVVCILMLFVCRSRRSGCHPIHVSGGAEGGDRAGELRAAVLADGGWQDLPTCVRRAEFEFREG